MLFGHQNDANQPVPDQSGANPLAVDPTSGVSLPAAPHDQWQQPQPQTQAPQQQYSAPAPNQSHGSFGTSPVSPPTHDNSFNPTNYANAPAPTQSFAPQPDTPAPVAAVPTSDTVTSPLSGTDDALLALKQQALEQLSPLVSHLEQSPEEKFRTTMMMIQSSDNQSLIKDAYEAAQAITDDKARAQALLDIVNEINYFTQHEDK